MLNFKEFIMEFTGNVDEKEAKKKINKVLKDVTVKIKALGHARLIIKRMVNKKFKEYDTIYVVPDKNASSGGLRSEEPREIANIPYGLGDGFMKDYINSLEKSLLKNISNKDETLKSMAVKMKKSTDELYNIISKKYGLPS